MQHLNTRQWIQTWNLFLPVEETGILVTQEVTRRGSNSRLLKHISDLLPHSFQVCTVAGCLLCLNWNVCSTNSNSISLGAQEPWGLK